METIENCFERNLLGLNSEGLVCGRNAPPTPDAPHQVSLDGQTLPYCFAMKNRFRKLMDTCCAIHHSKPSRCRSSAKQTLKNRGSLNAQNKIAKFRGFHQGPLAP